MNLNDPGPGGGCPRPDDLRRFALGRLADPLSDVVAGHVQDCSSCTAFLDDLDDSDDPLVRGLRDGGGVPPTADAPPRPTVGEGRYRILRHHADGGLGRVWVALDVELGREVALKQIRDLHADHPAMRARFRREATLLGALEHPGIVPVHGLGRDAGGRPYYAMRLIHGRTLAAAIRAHHGLATPGPDAPPATRDDLIGRFLDVCQAMAYAHSRGVIHRDLKPSNVMLGRFGETLVIDWGLAKVLGRHDLDPEDPPDADDGPPPSPGGSLTVAGHALGTPRYMSPEQARGASGLADRRSDVYGLGAILFEILTGRPPDAPAPAPDGGGDALDACGADPELIALARSCLRPDPSDRPRDASAVADALAAHLADVRDRLRDAEIARAEADARARADRARRRAVAALAASLALAGAIGGAWLVASRLASQQDLAEAGAALALAERMGRDSEALRARPAGDAAAHRRAVAAIADAWARAREEARSAEAAVAARLASTHPLAARAAGLRRDAERQADRARRRLERVERIAGLSGRLDDARLAAVGDRDFFNGEKIQAAWARTLRESDIDLDAPSDELIADLRTAADVATVAAAIDALAASQPGGPRAKLDAVVLALDPEGDTVRDAIRRDDAEALLRLADPGAVAGRPATVTLAIALALDRRGLGAGIVPLLTEAQRVHPGDFWLNFNLYTLLRDGDPAAKVEALRFLSNAVSLKPRSAPLRAELGLHLAQLGRDGDAESEFRRALTLDPNQAVALANLGMILNDRGQLHEAESLCRRAIDLEPDLPYGHWGLGNALLLQGRPAEALPALRRGHDLGRSRPGWPSEAAQLVAECEAFADLEGRLPAILRGEDAPRDDAETLRLGYLLYTSGRYAAAASTWGDAASRSPDLARDPVIPARYNAACAAIRAGRGEGIDAPGPDDPRREALRRVALAALRAELDDWSSRPAGAWTPIGTRRPPDRWNFEPDFDGVREPERLAELPEAERRDWEALWAAVEAESATRRAPAPRP